MRGLQRSWVVIAALTVATVSNAANVLWDINAGGGGTDATVADFAVSGVTEDLTGSSVSLVLGQSNAGNPMSDTNGVTVTLSDNVTGPYSNGSSSNPILNDYLSLRDNPTSIVVQISGLSSKLDPSTDYFFYIWGIGDNANQGAEFVFNGVTNEVSQADPDDPADPTQFVAKFSFTTASSVADTLVWTWNRTSSRWAGFNGFAIVADVAAGTLPPSGVTATGGDMQIDLTWNAEPSAVSYSIYRSTNDVDFALLASGVTTTNYTDSPVTINILHYYYITSVSNTFESTPSVTVSAIAYDGADVTPPAAPADFTAVQADSIHVQMNWTANTEPDLIEYLVYRALTADGVYSNIGTTTANSFIDKHGTQQAGEFDYKVTATDLTGNESADSTVVTVDMASRHIIEFDAVGSWGWLDAVDGRTEWTQDIGGAEGYGRNLGWTGAGEWTTHLVDLPGSGYYRMVMRCAVNNGGADAVMDISLAPDTNTVLGTIAMANTGGWQAWTNRSGVVYFPVSGVQTMQFTQVTGGFNLNWVELVHLGAKITSIDVQDPDVILAWDAELFQDYTVEESTDLPAGEPGWTPIPGLTNIPGVAGTMMATTTVSAAAANYRVVWTETPPSALYEWDMEDGAPGWTTNGFGGTDWELGTPTTGPGAANSGTNCWGTNLDSDHGFDATNVWLRTPEIDISGLPSATLRFWQFMDIEVDPAAEDWGIINVLDTNLAVVASEIFKDRGTDTNWVERTVSLPASAEPIIVEFHFVSDNFINQAGWYVDDVSVTTP